MPGIGELALFPSMLGASTTLLNADHYKVYFRGMPVWNGKVMVSTQFSEPPSSSCSVALPLQTLRRHGDEFERTASGYYRAHGRADDTMNLGGIKVGTAVV